MTEGSPAYREALRLLDEGRLHGDPLMKAVAELPPLEALALVDEIVARKRAHLARLTADFDRRAVRRFALNAPEREALDGLAREISEVRRGLRIFTATACELRQQLLRP